MQENILKTLAYYQALSDTRLTATEVQKYLLQGEKRGDKIPIFDIKKNLNALVEAGKVAEYNGFFSLAEHKSEKRAQTTKHTVVKWKEFKNTAWFLPYIPYVKEVYVTGSASINNSTPNSDIDILIKTKANRLWTTRFTVTTASWVLGSRRYGNKVTNRLCFNQYLSESATELGPKNINHIIKSIQIPVWRQEKSTSYDSIFSLKPKKTLLRLKALIEATLNYSGAGNLIEKTTGKLQIAKIKNNPVAYPKELSAPSVNSTNIIFYWPKVKETESKYAQFLSTY